MLRYQTEALEEPRRLRSPGVIHIRVKFDAGCQTVGQPPDELSGIGLAVEDKERASGGLLRSGGSRIVHLAGPPDILERDPAPVGRHEGDFIVFLHTWEAGLIIAPDDRLGRAQAGAYLGYALIVTCACLLWERISLC